MIENLARLLKLIKYLKDTDAHLEKVVRRTVREVQKKLSGVRAGDYDIFSYVRTLSASWVQRKGTEQALKDRGVYLRSIKLSTVDKYTFRVWTKEKALAKFLEFGTKTMAPIPHWRYIRRYTVFVFRKHMLNYLKGLRYLLQGA